MTFYIDYEVDIEPTFSINETVEHMITYILEHEQCPYETSCNLLITDKEGIRVYNKEYRKIDAPTDVLSFPNVDYDAPSDFTRLEDTTAQFDYFDLDTGELMLGDMVLAYDVIVEQAKEYEHSVYREFSFMLLHSMLHLLGYDHMEEDERVIMEAKQKEILTKMKIERDFIG
ncbi:MAG: rRNA maturation RNase YbeY [Eubacteriales bacterium]